MATTKIWKVQKRLDKVINYATNEEKTKNNYSEYGMDEFDSIRQVMTYATNPEKTEKQFYTTGINCEVKDAVKQMQFVKTIYGKEKIKDNRVRTFEKRLRTFDREVEPKKLHLCMKIRQKAVYSPEGITRKEAEAAVHFLKKECEKLK